MGRDSKLTFGTPHRLIVAAAASASAAAIGAEA
jgi:hypothetical protein